jgi:PAT family beta-lactamase induction signal transducer AmpG
VYLEPASLRMLALGFSAGLPLLLVLGTLSFRLREAGIDRSTIGYLSWVGLAYGFKWVWAPLVDRMPLPLLTRWLGRRRSWLLLSQAWWWPAWWAWRWPTRALTLGPHGVVRAGGGLWLGHARHCAGRLSHRIGRRQPPGRAGGHVPDGLPPGHDLGRRRRAVDCGARRGAPVAQVVGQAGWPRCGAYQNGAWQVAYLVMAASMAWAW